MMSLSLFIQSPRRLERDELALLRVPKVRFRGCVSLAPYDRAASENWHNRSQTLLTQVRNGSTSEELNVSKSSPLRPSKRTSTRRADKSQKGQKRSFVR